MQEWVHTTFPSGMVNSSTKVTPPLPCTVKQNYMVLENNSILYLSQI